MGQGSPRAQSARSARRQCQKRSGRGVEVRVGVPDRKLSKSRSAERQSQKEFFTPTLPSSLPPAIFVILFNFWKLTGIFEIFSESEYLSYHQVL